MKRTKVASSNIESVGYDEVGQLLEIEFTGGGVYQYKEVPVSVYKGLTSAESLGKYFHVSIKQVYEFEKVTDAPVEVKEDVSNAVEPKKDDERHFTKDVCKEDTERPFTRDELRAFRDRAIWWGKLQGLNSLWRRALMTLASCCDALDAMIARTEDRGKEINEGNSPEQA